MDIHEQRVEANGLAINTVTMGEGPLVLFVHGWPELSQSWRHQMKAVAEAGFKAAAIDVRGYGKSDKPWDVEAYSLFPIAGDVADVIKAISDDGKAVLVGHDWGAPIVHTTSLLYPDSVRAVVGMSVPHTAPSEISPADMWELAFKDTFFYMRYFQEEGIAELELGADTAAALKVIYTSASAEAASEAFETTTRPRSSTFLEGVPVPDKLPGFLDQKSFDRYVQAFAEGGWRGPLNRYRNVIQDWPKLKELESHTISQPSLFIGGAQDVVRKFIPGLDLFEAAAEHLSDCRGTVIVEGAGHWVQQEAPEETNKALLAFLAGL